MTKEQERAAEKLRKALIEVGRLGLAGGVYDGNFCLFPLGQHPEHDIDFFEGVEKVGIILYTPGVNLDGGAGI